MLIWNDLGGAVVNSDNVAAISVFETPDGQNMVVAFCTGSQTVLTAGDDARIRKCLDAVVHAWQRNQKVLDLREELGQRSVSLTGIVVPQGVPADALRAAREIMHARN